MYGLDKKSKVKEVIEKVDENMAIKYVVAEIKIDLNKLRREKASLERQLAEEEPSDKELLEMAKEEHPYYSESSEDKEARIAVIDSILEL